MSILTDRVQRTWYSAYRYHKTALVTNIAVLLNHNRPTTEAEKIEKYEDLVVEIKISRSLTTYLYTS